MWKVLKSHVQRDILNIKCNDALIACVLKFWCELHSSYIRQLYEFKLIPCQDNKRLDDKYRIQGATKDSITKFLAKTI